MIHSRDITYNLHKLVFLLDKISDQLLQENLQMSFSHFRLLMAMHSKDHLSQKDIAEYWDMTEAAVSRQVEMLIERKLIFIEENTENRRQHLLTLTSLGKKQLEKAYTILETKYEEIFAVINQRERKVMVEALHKLLKVICPGKGDGSCTRKIVVSS